MKKLMFGLIGLALCAQAAVWEATIYTWPAGGTGWTLPIGSVTATEAAFGYEFAATWDPDYAVKWAFWNEKLPDGTLRQLDEPIGPLGTWTSPMVFTPGDITYQTVWLAGFPWPDNAPRGVFERTDISVPEPAAFGIFGLAAFGVALRRRRLVAGLACLTLLVAGPAFAADDDPDAVVIKSGNVTRIEPAGFTVTLNVGPVVKVNGTNTATVNSILLSKLQLVRVLTPEGVQVGDTRLESLGTRNVTAWVFANKTNVAGLVFLPLDQNGLGRAQWAQTAWINNPQPQ